MTIQLARSSATAGMRWARALSWLALVLGIASLLGMLLSGPLYRFGVLGLGPGFGLMGLGAKGGIATIVIALIVLIVALLARRGRSVAVAVLAFVLGVLAFVPPLMFRHKAMQVPPIHDISTDTVNPPTFKAVLPLRADMPNSPQYGGAPIAAQQIKAYPDIHPLQFTQAPADVFAAALQVAHAMGWKIQAQDVAQGHIEATATTLWFGFKDDVVIRIRANNHGSRLDIRSESRVGKSDVGTNAARIRDFRSRLQNKLHPK